MYKDSVLTGLEHVLSLTETDLLMLDREIIAVCSEKRTETPLQ
jgi:hypothetical protein